MAKMPGLGEKGAENEMHFLTFTAYRSPSSNSLAIVRQRHALQRNNCLMKKLSLDPTDIRIPSAVQQYGQLRTTKLAELVNLLQTDHEKQAQPEQAETFVFRPLSL